MVELVEGEEPAEFWEPLGGKQKYASFSPSEVPKPPRLFHCKPPRYMLLASVTFWHTLGRMSASMDAKKRLWHSSECASVCCCGQAQTVRARSAWMRSSTTSRMI